MFIRYNTALNSYEIVRPGPRGQMRHVAIVGGTVPFPAGCRAVESMRKLWAKQRYPHRAF